MTTPWTKRTKPSTTWGGRTNRLLQEMGDFLLWEDGSKILLRTEDVSATTWTKR